MRNRQRIIQNKVFYYLLPVLIYLTVRLLITILGHLKYQAYDALFYTGLLGIYSLGIVAICLLTVRKGYGSMLSPLPFKWWHPVVAMVTFVTMLKGNFWLLQIFPTNGNSNEQALSAIISYGQGPFAIYGYLIWVVLMAPTFEELFFRLTLMTSYFKESRFYIDVLFSSFCFMAVHMHSWSDFGTPFALTFFITGISFGLVFKWTKSIIWVVLLHMTNNALANWDLIEAFILH